MQVSTPAALARSASSWPSFDACSPEASSLASASVQLAAASVLPASSSISCAERPRLSVFRSNRGLSAQLIDDDAGRTLAAASWTEGDLKGLAAGEQASKVGSALAERAKAAGVTTVVFDRGGFKYHGRVAAVADGARAAGLEL